MKNSGAKKWKAWKIFNRTRDTWATHAGSDMATQSTSRTRFKINHTINNESPENTYSCAGAVNKRSEYEKRFSTEFYFDRGCFCCTVRAYVDV
jgi:hypothetical protein